MKGEDADDDLKQSVPYRIWYLRHQIEGEAEANLHALGITLTQLIALHHVGERPGLSVAKLARALVMTRQSATILVKVLQQKQLIERSLRVEGERLTGPVLSKTGVQALDKGTSVLVPSHRVPRPD